MIQDTNGRGIVNAQCLSHGTITCRDLVKSRRIHQEALRLKDDDELQHIDPPRPLHGAYSFFLQDRDTNWWEIQYDERSINDLFALPDLDTPAAAEGG
jgi:hypothetical protein